MLRVRKNDTVVVIAGRDRTKRGKVIEILPKKDKVLVKGLGIIVKHSKPRKQGDVGGIKKIESYFHISNVMPICPSCNKAARVNSKVIEGKNVRICNQCKEVF